MDVSTAMLDRRSVRAFLPRPVPEETLRSIFAAAQRAPSWCNIQPWRVWLASGERRDQLVDALVAAAGERMPSPDVPFPAEYPEPYGTHRRQCGNFMAFDAPHVAIVGMDRRFALYGALDLGCWLQSVMLLASEAGVSTCAQASLALYPDLCRTLLGVTDDVQIVFGIGLGFEDPAAKANDCRTSREPVERNVVFLR
jgi:nitroreductase